MGIQVYSATHSGEGNPLSVLGRHFISFSYGGKKIEDFDLIAVLRILTYLLVLAAIG